MFCLVVVAGAQGWLVRAAANGSKAAAQKLASGEMDGVQTVEPPAPAPAPAPPPAPAPHAAAAQAEAEAKAGECADPAGWPPAAACSLEGAHHAGSVAAGGVTSMVWSRRY